MKFLFFKIAIIIILSLFALCLPFTLQSQNSQHCLILTTLLRDTMACQTFKFDKHKDLPIVFIDKKGIFKGCNIPPFYSREIEVREDTSGINETNHSNIILLNLIKYRKKFKMEVHQKYTGAYGNIIFRKRRNEFTISKFEVGYF